MRRLLATVAIAGTLGVVLATPASANTGCQGFRDPDLRGVCFTVAGPAQPVIQFLCEEFEACTA